MQNSEQKKSSLQITVISVERNEHLNVCMPRHGRAPLGTRAQHGWMPCVAVAGLLKLSQPGLTCSSFLPDGSNSSVSPESQRRISQVSNSAPETRRLSQCNPSPWPQSPCFLILHTVPFQKRLMVMYPYSHRGERWKFCFRDEEMEA